MKKLSIFTALLALSAALIFAEPKEFKGVSASQTVKEMKTGWNLGNTMDAPGGETSWGQPKTTKKMIDGLAASGIKTIRIPTSWASHTNKKTYVIDEKWMARVKQIVDWAIENDMYVILNSHHDNYGQPGKMNVPGYYPNNTNLDASIKYLTEIWTQIANTFIDYDEHLIFETMNEPRPMGTNFEWWSDPNNAQCKENAAALNKLNQAALDAIRATGGNNQKRYVMIPGLRASAWSVIDKSFVLPKDDEEGKLILSVHMYDPQDFAMNAPGSATFTAKHKYELKTTFDKLNSMYVSKGIPVVIGEYGATNKGNTDDRVAWFEYFLTESRKYGMCSVLWDNGSYTANKSEGEHFGYYNRSSQKWYEPRIIEKINEVISKE